MSTNAGAGAARSLASARVATAVYKKYTVQSTPFWDRIRRLLAVDPNRSTGVPLNPQYRNPPPGVPLATAYEDPVTIPAGDVAQNPYYGRDARRSYPKLSVVRQRDVVGLLSVGSKATPREVLPSGEGGGRMLVKVGEEGARRGVAGYFEKEGVKAVLGEGGGPVWASGGGKGREWKMDQDRAEGYPEEYPCRTFV